MSKPLTRTSKTRRWIEALLLLAGLIAVGIWGWSYARRAVYQTWANLTLNRRIHNHPSATVPSPTSPPQAAAPPLQNGALIGRLAIPRLDLHAVVREGAGHDTLDVALGHIPGTALPGQSGNVGVAGHRDTLFRGLRKIEKDDVIEFQTADNRYQYKVESTRIVKPDNVAVLSASTHPEMTLVTCYPFYYVGSAPDRFIVKARLIEPQTAAAPTAPQAPVSGPVASQRQPAHTQPSRDPRNLGRQRVASATSTTARSQPAIPSVQRVSFQVAQNNSRQIVPGIRLGLSASDAPGGRASIWMYMTPERRMISLRNQPVHQAVFFHGHDDGKQRELMITRVTPDSVTGYMLLYGGARASTRLARNQ
jgi:sortase A